MVITEIEHLQQLNSKLAEIYGLDAVRITGIAAINRRGCTRLGQVGSSEYSAIYREIKEQLAKDYPNVIN